MAPLAPANTSSNGPPQIPTGPRAGNYPYRSSIVTGIAGRGPVAPNTISGPQIIPGGRLMPSTIPSENSERVARLKAEQQKLEEENKIIQERKRRGLAAWDRAEREAVREAYKVELAEKQLEAVIDSY